MAEAYLHAKFRLDPSNRLATVHGRHRQDRQTDRQTDRQIIPPLSERGTAGPLLFSSHVYCGHGRPSQLLLSSCTNGLPETHTGKMSPVTAEPSVTDKRLTVSAIQDY